MLAIELVRRNVPFRLVDRLERRAEWARAIFVKSRSMEVFAAIGVEDAFLEQGWRVVGVDVHAGSQWAAGYRFEALDTPFPFILSIPEDETERILTARPEDLGGKVERAVEFLGLEETDQGVTARLRDPECGERELAASWVVGTDGLHSAVRKAADDADALAGVEKRLALISPRRGSGGS